MLRHGRTWLRLMRYRSCVSTPVSGRIVPRALRRHPWSVTMRERTLLILKLQLGHDLCKGLVLRQIGHLHLSLDGIRRQREVTTELPALRVGTECFAVHRKEHPSSIP